MALWKDRTMPFNAQDFLNKTVDAPMATSIKPCPEGEWTAMISTKVPVVEWFDEAEWKDKKTGQTKTQPTVKIPVEIVDERARELLPRETIIVPYDAFLDLLPNGHLDTGEDKNVRIGALREALGQNQDSGWTFERLFGAGPFKAKVYHETSEKRQDGSKFAKIGRVTRIR